MSQEKPWSEKEMMMRLDGRHNASLPDKPVSAESERLAEDVERLAERLELGRHNIKQPTLDEAIKRSIQREADLPMIVQVRPSDLDTIIMRHAIERQQARIAELEGIVRELLSALEDDGDYDNDATALEVAVDKSRAALEAK
jgi:hypothetical protein